MTFLRRLATIKTVLVAFILLGATYSIVTPIFEASDELWHYPLVQWLSKGNPLPIQDAKNVGPWKQEASQPPLYYYLTGWATFWIDTSDVNDVLRPNPHVDNGVITPDGNINLVIHDPAREAFPWRGTVLAVHIVRLLSVLMGAATVWLTYRIALELFPKHEWLALSAAAVNAFTPMFVFISGAVNNDNLAMMLCSLALLLIAKRLRESVLSMDEGRRTKDQGRIRPSSFVLRRYWGYRMGRWLPLGIVLGLAALTKTSALGLLLITALAVSIVAWKRRSWAEFFAGALATVIPVLLIAGWWYVRNIQLYGDVTGLSAFIEVLGQRAAPASLGQLWGERWGFMLSYWGLFGGVNVPLDEWVYHILNALAWLALIGLVVYLLRITVRWFREASPVNGGGMGGVLRDYIQGRAPLFSVGLFGVIVVAALTQWATVTWSSQGRLVFSAISTWSIFFVLGLTGWWMIDSPPRHHPLKGAGDTKLSVLRALVSWWLTHDRSGKWIAAIVCTFLLGVAAVAPFTTIAPAYARPDPVAAPASVDVPLDVTFGDRIRLIGADVSASSIEPGQSIEIMLYWQAIAPIEKDYSTFVHLLDEFEIPVAQRNMFPGQGLWPMSQMKAGDVIASRYVLNIPKTTYAPGQLTWEVGVYDELAPPDKPRLPASTGGDNVRFGAVALTRPVGDVPNPVLYNLGGQIELIGYDMDRRAAAPGETIRLTLYWRARSAMSIDYTIFTHVLQPPETIWAQKDKPLSPPTTMWSVGQVVSDTYDLTVKPETPPGVYKVEIGVYDASSPTFDRLRIITDDGRLTENYILLNDVRVR
ncbi:MAG TPA: glycosyltransferase family 39 protein [Anaerolineae bacterium]